MSFKTIFIAATISISLVLLAAGLHYYRPNVELNQPGPQFVRAFGKCAECHRNETSSIVHQYETSQHARENVTCLECHRPLEGQESSEHHGFVITTRVTSKNCEECHKTEYQQFLRSRHAAPAWAAVRGPVDFTDEQIAFAERYHSGAVKRKANYLAIMEGESAISSGCLGCHDIGRPNTDGSIGTCTKCHSNHSASIALAREPETCGQCHMGPDHSQLEIYTESKHGVLFNAQKGKMNLTAAPKSLTTKDMPVPTCTTCHMSGLEGMNVTHNVSERSSYWLFADISDKRPSYENAQAQMKETCMKCHSSTHVDRFYKEAEAVVVSTNEKVKETKAIIDGLRADGLLTPEPFDEPIEFDYFDYWHYFGRTAKHGAFMGGSDFVQWHGNYELLALKIKIEEEARLIRDRKQQSE